MEKITKLIRQYRVYMIGAVIGGIIGYAYWYFVGCTSGTCPLDQTPYRSVVSAALIGSLVLSMIFDWRSKNKKE